MTFSHSADSAAPDAVIETLGKAAKAAAALLARAPGETVNAVLVTLADALHKNADLVIEANRADVAAARARDLSPALIDRLSLDAARIESMARGIEAVISLPDPVGRILAEGTRPNGLLIRKLSVPLGVLGMIYESRPNVTIDAAALCLKSHNAVILRGGSESQHSSRALHGLISNWQSAHAAA